AVRRGRGRPSAARERPITAPQPVPSSPTTCPQPGPQAPPERRRGPAAGEPVTGPRGCTDAVRAGVAQPWRALNRGSFLLITKTLPWRRTPWAPGLFFSARSVSRAFISHPLASGRRAVRRRETGSTLRHAQPFKVDYTAHNWSIVTDGPSGTPSAGGRQPRRGVGARRP